MLLNKTYLAILKEFSKDYHSKLYGRKIAKTLNINQKTVSNILNELERQHILKYSLEGKNKYYFLNEFNPNIKEIIKIIETEKKIEFLDKNSVHLSLFRELEEKTKGILIIFGSYANNTAHKTSDLDVFVLGNISEVSKKNNLEVNIVKYDKKNFDENDVFIKEIIKNHIILKGEEEFIKIVW